MWCDLYYIDVVPFSCSVAIDWQLDNEHVNLVAVTLLGIGYRSTYIVLTESHNKQFIIIVKQCWHWGVTA